jgi:hypothetical protein
VHLSLLLAAVRTDGCVTDMGVNANWVVWKCCDFFCGGGGGGWLDSLQERKGVLLVVVRYENSVFFSVDSFSCLTIQLAHVTVCLTVQLAHVTVYALQFS